MVFFFLFIFELLTSSNYGKMSYNDMDIDDREPNSAFSRNDGSSRRLQQPGSVDLENLISGLRQDTRPQRASHEERETESKMKDIETLKRLWVSERVAPEILPFDEALLDRIMSRLRNQVSIPP